MMTPFFKLFSAILMMAFVASPAGAQLMFTEILYNPVGDDDGHELIEVQNVGDSPLDLRQWAIFLDNVTNSGRFIYQFETGRTLAPGAHITVHWRGAGTPDADDVYTENEGSWLSNPASEPIENSKFGLSLYQKESGRYVGPDWSDTSLIRDFVQMGTGLASRYWIAHEAGLWLRHDEVMGRPEGWALVHDRTGDTSMDWFARSSGFQPGLDTFTTQPAYTYGTGCVGSGGWAPLIPSTDRFPADGETHFQLTLLQALAPGFGYLILGTDQADIPFADCTLWVVPEYIVGPIPFKGLGQGDGTLQLDAFNPIPGSGLEVFITYFCTDPSMNPPATLPNAIAITL